MPRKKVSRKIRKLFRLLALAGGLYAIVTGVLVFRIPKKTSTTYARDSDPNRFFSDKRGSDRLVILDSPSSAGLARMKIIAQAEKKLDIAYFSIETGESPDLFFAALLEAADRGVQVNLLLDGIFHGIKGDLKPILYASILHPRMEIKFYEPLNPFMPWTLNNRMHDKYIIADDKYAMIGGRNIGDKYFDPYWYQDKVTLDRDVVIISTGPERESVISSMSDYFDKIWNHRYSKSSRKPVLLIRHKKAQLKYEELRNKLDEVRLEYMDFMEEAPNLEAASLPTNKISFIHNPIERFSKEPWIWYELSQLIKNSKKEVFIQSPYTIPAKAMVSSYFEPENLEGREVILLTNSLASSPNYPAFSGYLNHRKDMVDWGLRIFEYQSKNSLHTKAFIIDDDIMALGSFNGDPRSAFLSTESMVIIHGKEASTSLRRGLEVYMASSLEVGPDYNYIPREGLEESEVKAGKKILMTLLSYLVRPFEFLL